MAGSTMSHDSSRQGPSTSRSASLFLLAAAWIVIALIAGRQISLSMPAPWQDLVREGVAALLLIAGFYTIARLWLPELRPLSSLGLVRRPGTAREFWCGVALGWGVALALILPAVLTGHLVLRFRFDGPSFLHLMLSLAVLSAFAGVVQVVLAGLPLRLLIRSTGPAWAVAAALFVTVCLAMTGAGGPGTGLVVSMLAVALFCTGFLRTRALWLPLGLQLGWTVGLQLLFGAPSPYTPDTSGPAHALLSGPLWLTGAPFGPEASSLAPLILLAALFVLVRMTRDYAWHYTYQPVVAGGYPMDVPPPAQHVREEQRASATPLVQIGGLATSAPDAATLQNEGSPPHR